MVDHLRLINGFKEPSCAYYGMYSQSETEILWDFHHLDGRQQELESSGSEATQSADWTVSGQMTCSQLTEEAKVYSQFKI